MNPNWPPDRGRWSVLPFLLVVILAATVFPGCKDESTVSAAPNSKNKSAATDQDAARKAAETKAKPSDGSKAVSRIEGDRMQSIPKTVMSKQTESSPFRFAEIAKEAGIDFVHFSGMTDEKHFPTANGSGAAVFDFDGDGLLDIYFATCTLLPLGTAEKGPNRLYKNLGSNHFKDVTESSGLGYRGFCHGIITGDIDNDGDQDVFLCNYGSNVLYLNNGNGTFTDSSKGAGIDAPNWSSSGAMLDYDNDGFLDIYVSNYGRWRYPEDHRRAGDAEKKVWLYSSPRSIQTVQHLFFHNNGNNTFTNVYEKVIHTDPRPRSDGHGFGVVAADVNDDGLIDLFVANDMNPNFLFLNKGDGTFDDCSELSGAAFNVNGNAQSGMGVDAEDVDGDGLPELFVTNFSNEYSTLYYNFGKGTFNDNTAFYGLASDSLPWVKWGCALSDFDSDGWPDIFFVNGHVDNNRREIGQPVDYEEPPLLFHNVAVKGKRRFRLATRDAGPYFDSKHVGRGASFGDLDNDGDIDIVVNHKDAAPAVLRNDTRSANHWIRFILEGTKSNRDSIGAKVTVTAGGLTIHRQRKGGYSMQGTNDHRVLIGLGPAATVEKAVIRWPSGREITLETLKVDQDYKLVEPKTDDAFKPYTPLAKPAPAAGTEKAKPAQ
jgi:enediyne biosynthesis protein E4